jgi:hypothetical protein
MIEVFNRQSNKIKKRAEGLSGSAFRSFLAVMGWCGQF